MLFFYYRYIKDLFIYNTKALMSDVSLVMEFDRISKPRKKDIENRRKRNEN